MNVDTEHDVVEQKPVPVIEITDEPFILATLKEGSDDVMELPQETNGTVLLSTVQAQFPSAVGLKYKSSTGGWRGVKAEDNVLHAPFGGWVNKTFIVTESDALKPKRTDDRSGSSHDDRGRSNRDRPSRSDRDRSPRDRSPQTKNRRLLDDLIVLGLPYSVTQETLKDYFNTACGEVNFCQLVKDKSTGKSRGFGFVRFGTVEAASKAMKETHEIEGRRLVVRLSKRDGDTPTKLYVGKIPEFETEETIREYFSEFGELVDLYVPKPCRGFAFITYSDEEEAKKVLRLHHTIKGQKLIVSPAESKASKLKQQQQEDQSYGGGGNNNRNDNYNSNNRNDNYNRNNRNDNYNHSNNWRDEGNNSYGGNSYGNGPGSDYDSRPSHQYNTIDPQMLRNGPPQGGFGGQPEPAPPMGGAPMGGAGGPNDAMNQMKDMLMMLINNRGGATS